MANDLLFNLLPQYRDHAWKCWEELGIEELYGSSYYNIDKKVATNVLSSLHSKLMEAIAEKKLTFAEMRVINDAIRTLSDVDALNIFSQDIQKYIEASIAHKEQAGHTIMLVNNDHKFYNYFALSKSAEGVLLTQVQDLIEEVNPQLEGVVDSRPPICIKGS